MIDYKFDGKLYRFPDDFFTGVPENDKYQYLSERSDLDEYEISDGVKFDNNKPRWGLLPYDQLEEVVEILTFGAKKYKDDNWKFVKGAEERYFDALMRHIKDYRIAKERNDETLKYDEESGKNHLAHLICNALFLMWFDSNKKKQDVERKDEQVILQPIELTISNDNDLKTLENYCSDKLLDFIDSFPANVQIEYSVMYEFIKDLKSPIDGFKFIASHLSVIGELIINIIDPNGNKIHQFSIDILNYDLSKKYESI